MNLENHEMKTKIHFLAAAAGLATLVGGISAASAHGGHGMHQGHFFHHGFGPGLIISTGHDCSYAFDRWQLTGSYYWKHRYFDCRNGW